MLVMLVLVGIVISCTPLFNLKVCGAYEFREPETSRKTGTRRFILALERKKIDRIIMCAPKKSGLKFYPCKTVFYI